jgi:glyoxylase-like metal-dependent hydrolase (beta-lactamase superfamily II)
MLGEELRPGLRRWTARYEEWKGEVASVALVTESELVLIDPLLVGDQWSQLEQALGDRQLHVLLTIHWHARSTAEVARRFPGTRVWAHSRNRAAIARRTAVSDVFRAGEDLPAGLVALEARPRSEVLLWEPRSRALIVGDALLGTGEMGDGLHTCPASWLPRSTDLDDLRASLRPALDLPVELILLSHGAPVLRAAAAQLAEVATPSAPVPSRGEWESPGNHRTSPWAGESGGCEKRQT